MRVIYIAYSIDLERELGEFDAVLNQSHVLDTYDKWVNSLGEESVRFVKWTSGPKPEWYKSVKGQSIMEPVSVDNLPPLLKMRALIGA